MSVYVAHPDDIPAIREIARDSWRNDYPDILSRENVEETVDDWYGDEQLRAALEDPWTQIFVAVEPSDIVGFAHAVLGEHEGNVLRLYVRPGARRQGIGSELFERCRTELGRHDIEQLNAMVLAANDIGNGFYQNLGLERSDRVETTIAGETFEEHTYSVQLR